MEATDDTPTLDLGNGHSTAITLDLVGEYGNRPSAATKDIANKAGLTVTALRRKMYNKVCGTHVFGYAVRLRLAI